MAGTYNSVRHTVSLSNGLLSSSPDDRFLLNVRVLAMDESMKPIKDKQLIIDLISPTNMTVGRVNIEPGSSRNGFYRGQFQLPPFPDFGTWIIKAKLGGKLETYAISPIEVRDFVLPNFGVEISTGQEYIFPDMTNMGVTVSAKYVYGMAVEGNAGLEINVRKKGYVSDPKRVFTIGRQQLNNGKTFFVVNIKKIVQELGGQFPVESVLQLSSTVYESATGKEESGDDDSVMFVNCPFKFDLSRSKTTYRKGFTYYMQIYMLHANGKPAIRERFSLTVDGSSPEQHRTNKDGYYLAHIPVANQNLESRKIKVYAPAFENCATEMVLQPYTGGSQILVEKVEREGASFIKVNTNININQVAQYSGILMLITARGKIVETQYFPPSKDLTFKLEQDVLDKVSPAGRVFAFYVHNAQLVADSSFFHVDAKCRVQLELHPEKLEVRPGDSSKLTVTGPSGMWVGFNVIDKALLLLNSQNVLRENKLFREMEVHDLGCGAVGGTNSEEIFKNAGLAILTNANVNEARIQRETTECAAKKRKRRTVPYENVCCEEGRKYASDVMSDKEMEKIQFKREVSEPVPDTVCYSKARKLAETYQTNEPSKCPMACFEACVAKMKAEQSGMYCGSDVASGGSVLSDQDQYEQDVGILAGFGLSFKVRKIFQTSYFFEEHMISDNGLTLDLKHRNSITEWSIQAIGISENTGACIAVPKEVKTLKELFVQVDLPYKVTRKEMFNVKVTVSNYIEQEQIARVYLKGVRGLCYGVSPGEQSPQQLITLPPNGARTLTFPMIPLEAGTFPIVVSVFVTNDNTPSADIVEKHLIVVNEGINEKLNLTVCLDPNNQMENCIHGPEVKYKVYRHLDDSPTVSMEVELPLPLSSLPGTAVANAYIKSNLMDDPVSCVLEGVDKMFNEPQGDGEQNMMYTATIVYGMYFLKHTGTMNAQHEDYGIRYMRNGITRQQSMYQKDDGSYAIWKTYPTSLWLTAFVAKVFCQAEHLERGMSDPNSLQKTLAYISKNNLEGSGDFRDDSPVVQKEMQGVFGQGETRSGPSLTSFVLTSLQECPQRTVEVYNSINRAVAALERLPINVRKNNPYLLAISTYSLACFHVSDKTHEFRKDLYEIRRNDEGRMYWSNSGVADSYAIETTAYALLAFLKFDDFKTSHKIVAWLITQSDAIGKWRSTQATVVAMQALATYSARTYNTEVDLKVVIEKGYWKTATYVYSENSLLQILIPDLPVQIGHRKFDVTASGRGSGILQIDMFYNRKARDDEICPFEISVIDVQPVDSDIANNPNKDLLKSRKCNVCGYCQEPEVSDFDLDIDRNKRQATHIAQPAQTCIQFSVKSKPSTRNSNDAGLSIVEVNLETGVRVVESDLFKMQNEGVFPRYEIPKDGKGFVIFYLDSITSAKTKLIFRLEDQFSGDDSSRQPAIVKVYDYYTPGRSCIKQYGIGSNPKPGIKYMCEDGSDQCQCMQSQCMKQVNQELFEIANTIALEKDAVKRRKLRSPVGSSDGLCMQL
ncbi:complement C3-like isoform X3 [Dreissena polymorpha]|uniref:complement C3-like isoform X3 n=1 Tax=Dreissena polymorpha TaxID=45954 RepID=UPI002263F288|nr:complement C3-like isoform X3 [Dreissena polymorpha]